MRKIYLLIVLAAFLNASIVRSQNLLSENFDNIPLLFSSGGWSQQNNSVPLGAEIWHNGMYILIPPVNGAADSYAEVSFESTTDTGVGDISNWLITPPISLVNGDEISFYTTSEDNTIFPDRLEIRLNVLNTTNVGTTVTSVGDFSSLLLEINPNLLPDTSQYPQGYWGQFIVPISGLTGATTCRIAFRYFVTDGGGSGDNSSTIGVDAFSVDRTTVDVSEFHSDIKLNVYPNPVSDKLTISFERPLIEKGMIHIYDIIGQALISLPVQQGQIKAILNTSLLPKGVYSLVFESPETKRSKIFIKD